MLKFYFVFLTTQEDSFANYDDGTPAEINLTVGHHVVSVQKQWVRRILIRINVQPYQEVIRRCNIPLNCRCKKWLCVYV
jgi:hypothetical protein